MQMNLIIASDYYDRSYSQRKPPPHPLPVIGPSGNPPKKLLPAKCLEMNWIRFIMTILSLLNNPQKFFYQLCYGLLPLYLEHLIS